MLTIICQKCNNEFKVSGADLDEHKNDGTLTLCPVCRSIKKEMKEHKTTIPKNKKEEIKKQRNEIWNK